MALPNRNRSKGFTLVETLVALALISIISLIVMGALAPWMGFKQKLDTERRLQDVRTALTAAYSDEAMGLEKQASGTFGAFVNSTPGEFGCDLQTEGFERFANYFSEAPAQVSRDGFSNPWCVFITPTAKVSRDGVDLWYRVVHVVSTGPDGVLSEETVVQPDGSLTVGGDDLAVSVSGREIQAEKLKETMRRMNKVAQMYETYYTTRYLANASRDISVYYFSTAHDPSGAVESTKGTWAPAATALAGVGVGPSLGVSAWETDNAIELGNTSESSSGVQVRSPSTTGTGVLPYTALLRTALPAPSGQTNYATQVVVGNF